MRFIRVLAALLLIVPAGCSSRFAARDAETLTPRATTVPSPSPSPSPTPVPVTLDAAAALEHNRILAVEIGLRAAGTDGEVKAAAYIEATMRRDGLSVSRQPFTRRDGGPSVNIVARIPGADYSKGFVLVGAHYDTVPSSPGGNDNGSGTGLMMSLAASFARTEAPIEFVAFAAEERHPVSRAHHEGSEAYVAALADPRVITQMISLDMVGNGPRINIMFDRANPTELANQLAGLAAELGIPARARAAGSVSDHTSFSAKGIPAVVFWTGARPEYHSAKDTFATVQPEAIDRAGRLALEWLKRRFSVA